jgi:hypothetical protein
MVTDILLQSVPLDPLTELRVRALEDATGNAVVDVRIWRRSPADTSRDAWCPTAQGFAVPLATFPLVLRSAWKVQRRAAEQDRWAKAADPVAMDLAS